MLLDIICNPSRIRGILKINVCDVWKNFEEMKNFVNILMYVGVNQGLAHHKCGG